MKDKTILFENSCYDKSKHKTYATRAFSKNDGSDRWVVEYYDIYEDNTEILSRAVECDKDRVGIVTYLISK